MGLMVARQTARGNQSALGSLGCVDSKDSLLGANRIQDCFWGASLGREGSFGIERRGVEAQKRPAWKGVAKAAAPRLAGLECRNDVEARAEARVARQGVFLCESGLADSHF